MHKLFPYPVHKSWLMLISQPRFMIYNGYPIVWELVYCLLLIAYWIINWILAKLEDSREQAELFRERSQYIKFWKWWGLQIQGFLTGNKWSFGAHLSFHLRCSRQIPSFYLNSGNSTNWWSFTIRCSIINYWDLFIYGER